ncbi:hypothetical protein [Haloarchaeobius baliensis]|uniref:hypothetical protein n=1 Tax=Haloarchaeobius baliensis TaxID=1670458 RepID=UPI003F882F4E
MRRRALLSTSGVVLAGLAGCLSESSDDDEPANDTTNSTDTPTDAPTTEPPRSAVTVSLESYQPAIIQLATDSIHTASEAGAYLFLSVDASEADDPPSRSDFAFELDGTSHSPVKPDERRLWRQYSEDGSYGGENATGWLLFELPEAAAAEDARVTWPDGEWRPGESLRTRLAAEYPPMSMEFSVPETVPNGEHPMVTITVQNEGAVDARFVAGLNRVGPRIAYTPVAAPSFVVPAGGSETWEHTGDYDTTRLQDDELGDGQHDVTYHLDSVLGRESRDVSYVSDDS